MYLMMEGRRTRLGIWLCEWWICWRLVVDEKCARNGQLLRKTPGEEKRNRQISSIENKLTFNILIDN